MPQSFDLFCHECNIRVETRLIATGHGNFTSQNPFQVEDSEYTGDVYHVTLCPRCNSPFLLKESTYGVPGEFETVTDTAVLHPKKTHLDLEGVPPRVTLAYEQALRCYTGSSFDACVLMCRRALEALAKSLGIEKGTLEGKLKVLADQGLIEARLVKWAHGIRVLGNEAAHDTDTELTQQDARDALDFIEALLTYVFVLNAKFEAFLSRRSNSQRAQSGTVKSDPTVAAS